MTHLLKYIYVIPFLFFTLTTSAQQAPQTGGTVSGKLIDAETNEPLSFATVALINKVDNKAAASMQTTIDGNFSLTNIASGAYILRATYVSYLSLNKDNILIDSTTGAVQLGTLKLTKAKGVLKEVTVSATKSQIKLGIDKKTFDVSESLVSQGGSATDLLANVPSIQVDVDGNVSLRGSSSVRVLINGKATPGNLADILQALPANAVESVEVITNPSSKYQAEGQSGIINIVLKKNAQLGLSGNASVSVGNLQTHNESAGLAYKTEKVNIYGNYSYRGGKRIGNGFFNRTTTDPTGTQFTNQIADQSFNFKGHNIRSGIDLFLNDNNTLSFSNNINLRNVTRNQGGLTTTRRNGQVSQVQDQDNFGSGKGTNMNFNLDFEHKFKRKGELLTTNISYGDETGSNLNTSNTSTINYLIPSSVLISNLNNNKGKEKAINLQADYTLPFENGKFEAGYRSTLESNRNDNRVDTLNQFTNAYNYSDILSNNFLYKQDVHAVYANYQRQFGNFGIQGGLRLEDAYINTESESFNGGTYKLQKYNQHYLRLYPTLFLTQKLSESQSLQLSYSRRVSRPRDRQVSPFLDVSNRQGYSQGNPNLRPEDTHSFEFSYINYMNSLVLTSSLYYRQTNQNIQRISTLLSPDLTLSTFDNIGSTSSTGYELIAKYTPATFLDLTANVNAFYLKINGDDAYNIPNSSGFSWNSNLTAAVKASKKLSFQLRGDYRSEQVNTQGRTRPVYGMDAALKYDIIKGLTFGVNSRDVFNSRKFISETHINNNGITLDQTSQNRRNVRTVMFSLSFRFGGGSNGDSKRNKNRENNSDNDDEDQDSMDSGATPAGK